MNKEHHVNLRRDHFLTDGVSACLEHLRTRLAATRERGDMLLEALIFMAVIAITASAYLGTAMTSQSVVRSSQSTDIAAQEAQATMEKVKALPWGNVAFNSAQQTGVAATWDGKNTVKTTATLPADQVAAGSALNPLATKTVKGVTMTQKLYIVWRSGSAVDPAASGTKDIYIVMEHTRPGEGTARKATYTMSRTASPAEAKPIALPGAALGGTPGDGSPGCIDVYRKDPNYLEWARVWGATAATITTITNGTAGTAVALSPTATIVNRVDNPTYKFRFTWTVNGVTRNSCADVQ